MEHGCNTGKCGNAACEGKQSSGCEITDIMVSLADDAWACLMKDKMKAEFEKQRGKQMSQVAAAAVEASIAAWEHKMAGKMKCNESKEKMEQAFMA